MKKMFTLGFLLVFACIKGWGQTITMSSAPQSTCSATYYDPGGPSNNYGNNLDYTQTITPGTAGSVLQVSFSSFRTESGYDYLSVYNGSSVSSSSLIGTYSGSSSPGVIVSTATNGALTFVFHSDGAATYGGWAATLSCVAPAIAMSNTPQTTCSATYLDPGGNKNYSNNQSYTQTFTPSAGNRMQITFSLFNTEQDFDYLYIYNGNSTSAPLIGQYSGTSLQGQAIASTANDGSLTFKFVSDAGVVSSGWVASLSCVAVPYRDLFISMNTGSTTWCAGETRDVTVTVKNTGTATWTDASPDINIGVKWNTNGTSWQDYHVRVNAGGLAAGATNTYTLPITASNNVNGAYTTPLAAGSNNLTFDVVYEGVSWFGDNGSLNGITVGPGNTKYVSAAQTIVTPATITTQPGSKSACDGASTSFTVAATGSSLSYQWQVSTNGGSSWANITNAGVYTGATSATLSISNTTGLSGYQYRVVVGACGVVSNTATLTLTPQPSATISYANSPYCKSLTSATVTRTGTAGGTYSASPAGLSIDANSGAINPSASTANNYTVTYTVAASNGCSVYTRTAPVTITAVPVATFSYAGTPYCKTASNPAPTYSGGGAAGVFSATPAGLTFVNTATGQVNLSASTPGTYTVTNTRAAANGCSEVSAQATITITAAPSAFISYQGSPFCKSVTLVNITRTGTAGGTYSAFPAGLTINAGNGRINPSTSTPGDYTVTYTVAASGGCSVYTTTTPVTISDNPPAVSISPVDPSICAGDIRQLTASGGVQTGTSVTETFNGTAQGWTTVNSSTGFLSDINAAKWTLRPNAYLYNDFLGFDYVFRSNDNSQFYLSNSDDQGLFGTTNTTLTSPVINTTGYQTLTLSFYQNFIQGLSGTDAGEVQVSTDGSNFTTVKSYTTDQGTETYNSSTGVTEEGFVQATVNLNTYINKPTLYIRFKYTADFGFWWALDNVTITGGNTQLPITWSPVTNLYTNAAATTPYTAGAAVTTVYAKPGANTTYTATATNNSGCTASGSSTITVKQTPTVSITPSAGACEGQSVGINITGDAGTSVKYTSSAGGSQQTVTLPTPTINSPSNTGTYTYTINSATLNGCSGTITNGTATVNIYAKPNASISGYDYVQIGNQINLTGGTSGGVWSSDNTSATVGSSSGTVTGVSSGTANITYQVSKNNNGIVCSGSATKPVNITADYVTRNHGNFSDFTTWKRGTVNGFVNAASGQIPASVNTIEVQHDLALDQNFQVGSGKSFVMSAAGTMTIQPGKVFSAAGSVDFGHKAVIVKSTVAGTGAIGQMASAIANADNVTVERYTDAGSPSTGRRAWRLVTSPVTNRTIHEAWQEGNIWTGASSPVQAAGYGTLITGEKLTPAQAQSVGFDYIGSGNHTSIKQYTPATGSGGSWDVLPGNGTTGTNIPVSSQPAWMLFVRGDRTANTRTAKGTTTLRATGVLNQAPKTIAVDRTKNYTLVGNPYAAPIDFDNIYNSTISRTFIIWNSSQGVYGAYNYITKESDGSYTVVPFNSTAGSTDNNAKYIQSGSGFFVSPASGSVDGSLTIDEQAKNTSAAGGTNTFREILHPVKKLWVNLDMPDSDTSSTVADGVLARFDDAYSADIDEDDAVKQWNFNENLNISHSGRSLMIDARPDVAKTDTVQLKVWSLSKRNYQLRVKADNFATEANVKAWLEDSYLGTKEPLSLAGDLTTISFTVNSDSASSKNDRFRIVFQNSSLTALPVTLTNLKATPKDAGVSVNWTAANEVNMKGYTVEASRDGGRTYTVIATAEAKNRAGAASTTYDAFDAQPVAGNNLYRIRIEAQNGAITYSNVVSVALATAGTGADIVVYPNPVREGKVHLRLSNLAAGTYLASVYSQGGQRICQKKIVIGTGSTVQSEDIILGSGIAQGSYQLRVTDDKGNGIKDITLMTGK